MGRRLLVVGVALALAVAPRPASAHALLFGSDPAPDAVLRVPPATVTLAFAETVDPVGKAIKVFTPTGREVAGPARARRTHLLTASIRSAETGTYVVVWQVVAADTHPSRGAFRFVVGQPSANPYSALLTGAEIGTAPAPGLALQALARWMHFLGVALTFGLLSYQLVIGRDPRLRRLVIAGLALLIIAEPIAFVAQLTSLSFDGDTAIAVLASSFGRVLGLRLAIAILAWALLALEPLWPLLCLGVVMVLIDGITAHAIPGAPGAGVVLNALHVAAMALWVGGLIAFLSTRDRRFARYVLGALAVSVLSGLLLALVHVGSLHALLTTDYGWALAIKVMLVGVALGSAACGRRRVESGLMVAILALAGILVSLPPPR